MRLVRNRFHGSLAAFVLAMIPAMAAAQDAPADDATGDMAEEDAGLEAVGGEVSAMTVTGGNATALISYPVGTLLFTGAQACLEEGGELSLKREDGSMTQYVGPGCDNEVEVEVWAADSQEGGGPGTPATEPRRPRLGAVRGGGSSGPKMAVVRGSSDALRWYPVGRQLAVGARVCLPANARFVTFERLDGGGRVTYTGTRGNGCDQTIAEPAGSGEQAGAGSGP